MRKSTLFISAVLTTFVLAMLAGVASAYQNLVVNDQAAKQQTETTVQEQPELQADVQPDVQTVAKAAAPVAEEPVNLSPQDAVALAGQIMGKDDLYSVEVTELNGETVYLVTFSSGDLVYVSLDGQVRYIGKLDVQTVVVNVSSNGGSRGGGGGGGDGVDQSNNAPSSRGDRANHEDDGHSDHEDGHEQESHDD